MSPNGQKCRGTCPYGVNMTSKWRINFQTCVLKNDTSFHESWTTAWSLFCASVLFITPYIKLFGLIYENCASLARIRTVLS